MRLTITASYFSIFMNGLIIIIHKSVFAQPESDSTEKYDRKLKIFLRKPSGSCVSAEAYYRKVH